MWPEGPPAGQLCGLEASPGPSRRTAQGADETRFHERFALEISQKTPESKGDYRRDPDHVVAGGPTSFPTSHAVFETALVLAILTCGAYSQASFSNPWRKPAHLCRRAVRLRRQ